jgi:drug/metabolite transporter (DMT)-like permease
MLEAVLLGVVAALSWSIHDVIARGFAGRLGPFRLAMFAMVIGGLILTPYVLWRGAALQADSNGLLLSLALGVAYGTGIGTLYKAFSLGPVSVVAPLTAAYPAIVVIWGLFNGLAPSALQWLAVASAMVGALIIARSGHHDGGINAVERGKMPLFLGVCALSLLGFATAFILGQRAAVAVGEFEAAWISRLTGMLTILPFALGETRPRRLEPRLWLAVIGCALFDVIGLVAMNASGHFPGREFAAVGISAYGATAVVLAAAVLKERVSPGQWTGIALIVGGVAAIALSE